MNVLTPYVADAVVAIISAIVVALIGLMALRLQRRRPEATGADSASLQRDLAVAQERLSQRAQIGEELAAAQAKADAERQANVQAQTDLAGALAANGTLEASIADARSRIESAEQRLVADAAAARAASETAMSEQARLKVELATTQEALQQERRQANEKQRLLLDAKELMTKEFQVLANDVMSRHGEAFTKQNKEQLDVLLTPLRDKLREFQEGLQSAHTDSAKERATLGEQIKQLSEHSSRMTTETVNLTRALKGRAQTQGAWGEMILDSLLQKSGLREGEEYFTQVSQKHIDGQRLRPDVVVNLPNGQQVIIDAKVSLVAFERYVNEEDEGARETASAAHLASMRTHIKHLASKDYQSLAGDGLDYVIMFVPIEGALAVALQRDPNLTTYAVQNNVAIATPTTLMMALRTIENVWQVERRNRNAEAIAERAGHLYNKFVGFLEEMQKVGHRLDLAQASYRGAMSKLSTGNGNLVSQAEKLRELGARTNKALPKEVAGDAWSVDEVGPSDLIVGRLEGPINAEAEALGV
jgi:DNA recombination protein RmuC